MSVSTILAQVARPAGPTQRAALPSLWAGHPDHWHRDTDRALYIATSDHTCRYDCRMTDFLAWLDANEPDNFEEVYCLFKRSRNRGTGDRTKAKRTQAGACSSKALTHRRWQWLASGQGLLSFISFSAEIGRAHV